MVTEFQGVPLVSSGSKYRTEQGFAAIKNGVKVCHQHRGASPKRKPLWLKAQIPSGGSYKKVKQTVRGHHLTTVCEESICPNIGECWGNGTATLMLMGAVCTRACRFCAVDTGNPGGWLDLDEPVHAARSVELMGLTQRPKVTRAVSEAAAQGDRSENAEYIYGKKQLREIDKRIRHLRKRLEGMQIIDRAPSDTSKIYFGAWFELEDQDARKKSFRLVGPDEFDSSDNYISMDSPLGKAVMGKAVDDKITVRAPSGEAFYTIVQVSYHSL